jgi:hypothetical protein
MTTSARSTRSLGPPVRWYSRHDCTSETADGAART